ncbi:RDD family protein [Massilia sp. CF038]|uniref:RDD family protein n=1 Tax=Massilia sp. CF038 TaxID=1881045 RepID=UPI0009172854|nr:RDD family protein [Massilia sp. CF038]SHG55085.1 Uncharacterized membrane protein YckC, RDD family [Massilia sp. CF038]
MQNSTSQLPTPSLKRRLISLVYEAFLVTAVSAFGMLVFVLIATPFHNETLLFYGRQITLFLVVGAYFIHAWTGSGFTLAMKTWRIKIVMLGHAKVPLKNAIIRYVLAWGWILPALAGSYARHLTRGQTAALLGVGILGWAMTALFDKDRQFLHDRLAGTRLISLPKPEKKTKAAA